MTLLLQMDDYNHDPRSIWLPDDQDHIPGSPFEIFLPQNNTRMKNTITGQVLLQDREEAGRMLSEKLNAYKNGNAVVIGIPHGGVFVASALADELSLPMEVMPCRSVRHPADTKKTIGSVSANAVVIHDLSHAIPQDYIYHQIALLRRSIQRENRQYYSEASFPSLLYKTIILVDDFLETSDSIMASLREIKRQKPLRIIVAVPIVNAESARIVRTEADDIIFIRMEHSIGSPDDYFNAFPNVDEAQVKGLLNTSRKTVRLYE